MKDLETLIFTKDKQLFDFKRLALSVFNYQATKNRVYKSYLKHLNIEIKSVNSLKKIPFLPIEFFKSKKIIDKGSQADVIFKSSGTGGLRSQHYVADIRVYEKSFMQSFETFYGNLQDYKILALLPSYLEQGESSLVYMVDKMISAVGKENGGFYKDNFTDLDKELKKNELEHNKVILIGVSYALVDFFEAFPQKLKHTIVMETGGMKGRKKEMIREELHAFLKKNSGVSAIHSEYGMTELLSQAYSQGNGLYTPPAQLKILIRDPNDPFSFLESGKSGGVNIIDLSNLYSCAFIETSDLGKVYPNGTFEILGRFDSSDLRGCNLLSTKGYL